MRINHIALLTLKLLSISLSFLLLVMTGAALAIEGPTTRISVNSGGTQGNDNSTEASISADGRFVAFTSAATNIVAGDTNGFNDVFVHDRQSGVVTRVSVDSNGTQGNNDSSLPSISADGRYIAFMSSATNLVAGDTNGWIDVFVHDRQTAVTTRVSISSNGDQGNHVSTEPAISADGRYVAFSTSASNIVAGDTNGTSDIFVHDRQAGQTTRVSVKSNGAQCDYCNTSASPSISADGRYVAFYSWSSDLVAGDTNGTSDIFVHDRQTGQTTRVSMDSSGIQSNNDSNAPSISGDGRYVAFHSYASNLVAQNVNASDIYVHDRQTGVTSKVSVSSSGQQGDGQSVDPAISADGRYVAFISYTSNLVAGDSNPSGDVLVHDIQTGVTALASVNSNGQQGVSSSGSYSPSISADGRFVAFHSYADNLVSGDSGGYIDIFVHDRQTAVTNLPTIQFTSLTSSGSEAATPAAITVTLSAATSQTVTVNYATADGTATAGSDYTAASGTLTFNPGVTSQTISVPITNDTTVEANETFTVTLSGPVNASLGSNVTHTYTINNDDNAALISFSAAAYTVSEAGKAVTITATRTGSSSGSVGVSYATSNGTATAGSDYTGKTGTLSWANGDMANKTVSVSITNDTLDEANETFNVILSNPTGGASLGTPGSAVVTITDDDKAPVVQFSAASSSASETTTSAAIVVTLSTKSGQPVMVNYATANGTATAGSDYTVATGTLTFNPGETSKTITIPIINDTNYEANETFTVKLTSPVNATLGTKTTHTRTITNDDAKPKVQFQSTSSYGSEATTPAPIAVLLSGASYQTVTVKYATANGTATAGSDYTATTGTLTFNPGETSKTINIPIINDTAVESNETFTIKLTSPTNATLGTTVTHTRTINNDDNPGNIQLSSATYSAGEADGTVTITATRTGGSSGIVGISYGTANNTATSGSDYTATNSTLSWANGDTSNKTFIIPITNDALQESDETFTVALSAPTGGATLGSPFTATVTIIDDDYLLPLSLLTMNGAGFNPNAEATVHLFNGDGYSIEVPATEITSNTVSFVVPPFIDSAYAFSAGTVSWEVIQVSDAGTNRVSGATPLNIGALPALTMPPGTVLANYMGFLELYLADVEADLLSGDTFSQGSVDSQSLRTALENVRQQCAILKTAIRNAIADPGQLPVIGNFNGMPISLDSATLTIADQFITAMAQGLIASSEVLANEQIVSLAAMAAASNPSCHLSVFEQWDAVIHSSVSETMAHDAQARLLSDCADYYRSLGNQFGAVATIAGIASFLIPPSAAINAPVGLVMGITAVGSSVLAVRMDYVVKALKSRDKVAFERSQAAYDYTTKQYICFGVGQVLGSLTASSGDVGGVLFDIISGISGLCDEEIPQWEQRVQTFVELSQVCTSFTYTEWSACQPDNIQIRTVATSSPEGCTGGAPLLVQSCLYIPPACTYTYTDWSACQPNNTQTRTVSSSSPEGCIGVPVVSQQCTYVPPAGGAYAGPFSGVTYETHPDAKWKNTISATITVTVFGNGTLSDPYSGIMNVEGTANVTLEYCHSAYGCDPGGIVPFNLPGVVTGSFGKVEAFATTTIGEAVISATLTDGVINGSTMTGIMNFDAGGDAPIIKNITLTK